MRKAACDVLNVKNGILNLQTVELNKHSPDHLSAIQLPVKFDPTATCPKIDRFTTETFPEDATTVAYEIPAWLMTPDTSIQKAVLLIGPGGNGKSRYLRMVEALSERSAFPTCRCIDSNPTSSHAVRLYGKLANICPDLPTEHLAGTSIFKAITGGDPVTGEYKFKDSFDFVPFARWCFQQTALHGARRFGRFLRSLAGHPVEAPIPEAKAVKFLPTSSTPCSVSRPSNRACSTGLWTCCRAYVPLDDSRRLRAWPRRLANSTPRRTR